MKSKTYMITNEVTRLHVFNTIDNIGDYEVTIKPISNEKKRTILQNASIHLYAKMLSESYIAGGLDMQTVLAAQLSIPWSKDAVFEHQWRAVQLAMGFERSTTKLETGDVNKIYDVLNGHSASNFGIAIDFPCEQSMRTKALLLVE